jgi:hypothetical protein
VWGLIGAAVGFIIIGSISLIVLNIQKNKSVARNLQQHGIRVLADRDFQTAEILLGPVRA